MTHKFPSDEWMKIFAEEINRSEAYASAAAKWEGDFYWIVEPALCRRFGHVLYTLNAPKKRCDLICEIYHSSCSKAIPDSGEKLPGAGGIRFEKGAVGGPRLVFPPPARGGGSKPTQEGLRSARGRGRGSPGSYARSSPTIFRKSA